MQRFFLASSIGMFALILLACSGSAPIPNLSSHRTAGPPDTKDGTRVEGADQPFIIGGLQATLRSPRIGTVILRAGQETRTTDRDYFVVMIDLIGADPGKRFDYTTWAKSVPTLRDDLGNSYRRITWDTILDRQGEIHELVPVGRMKTDTIYSDKRVTDVLAFERPVPAAKFLDLDLPVRFDGIDRSFQFRLKTNDIK